MSELDQFAAKIERWVQPLDDADAPCGPDLEYDNEFLALTQAAAGKPDSQFGPAEPPNWREVLESSEELLDRSRDLRIAIFWLRASVHLHGYEMLGLGLRLVAGMMELLWDTLHPLPDPDDGDPYARVNALTVLRENEGLIGDLRTTRLVSDRAIGQLDVRAVEVTLGLSPLRSDETEQSREQISQLLTAALEKSPTLRASIEGSLEAVQLLQSQINDKLDSMSAPDLKPLLLIVKGIVGLMPAPAQTYDDEEGASEEGGEEGESGGGGGGGKGRRLAGAVTSREDAIRAIDMVCAYLEQAEPTNPAPFFLKRAKQLLSYDFLQLMKVLAPDALHEVAKLVGIDPETVVGPDGT